MIYLEILNRTTAYEDVWPPLVSIAEKMNHVINSNHEGAVQRGDKTIVQLFNNENKYNGNTATIDNRTVTVRRLDENSENVFESVVLNDLDNPDRGENLLDRHRKYMYSNVLNGTVFGLGMEFMIRPSNDLLSMLSNIGIVNSQYNRNLYTSEGGNYIYRFYNSFGNSNFVNKPSDQELRSKAQAGYTVGQVLGSDFFNDRSASRYNPDIFGIDNFFNQLFDTEFERLVDGVEEARNELVEAYLPGLTRLNQPFSAKTSLDTLLNQNLLLEGNVGTGRGGRLNELFDQLYVNSRTRTNLYNINTPAPQLNDIERFVLGTLSNVPILDIQRQAVKREGGNIDPPSLFSFERHDKNLLENDKLERGYKQNISGATGIGFRRDGGVVSNQPAGQLTPAIYEIDSVNSSKSREVKNNEKEMSSYARGKLQFFPFSIETDNKDIDGVTKNVVCEFQALIAGLNESSNPNWSPKHYFGRTEQVHTYQFTERNLDLSLNIYAETMHELANLKYRVNFLLQQTYGQLSKADGDYSSSFVTAGPIVRLTLGDLYNSLPGMITSLNINWGGPGGSSPSWEMTKGLNMPWICTIQMGYRILHSRVTSRTSDFYPSLQYGIDGGHFGDGSTNIQPSKRLIPTSADENVNGTNRTLSQRRVVPGISEPAIQST